MKKQFTIDTLNHWDFCNKEDEKIVLKYLKENKKVEYSENKFDNQGKVFIFINNKPQYVADIKPKL